MAENLICCSSWTHFIFHLLSLALGTPKDVNAWIYTSVSQCPFSGNTSIDYWDDEQKDFVEETNLDNIQIECVKNDENQKQNIWFETMSKENVDNLIKSSTWLSDLA